MQQHLYEPGLMAHLAERYRKFEIEEAIRQMRQYRIRMEPRSAVDRENTGKAA